MNTTNSALIHSELLFDVARVLEDGYPVGPSFANSLSTLVEAVVIHDQIILPSAGFEHSEDTPWASFYHSDLIKALKKEGVLTEPPEEDFEKSLQDAGTDFDYLDFLTDVGWTRGGFLGATPEAEESTYRAWIDIATYAPQTFSLETLVPDEELGMAGIDVGARPLVAHGFTISDLINIEGYNRAMRGYQKLSRRLGVHFYSLFQSAPHQLGAINAENSKVRNLFDDLQKNCLTILDTDETVGDDAFRRIDIPPLCQIVLEKCKGSQAALFDELLALRRRHRELREFLAAYEEAWNAATTKEEARRLKADLKQAFEGLARLEASPTTRWLYRTWDIVKSPAKILEKIGDTLVEKGKQYYAVDRIWGLHDFYKDLRESPVQKRNYALFESMFDRFAPEPTWSAASDLADKVENNVLTQRSAL